MAGCVRARRKDCNHGSVGDYLRNLGWSVLDLAQYGMSIDYAVSKDGYAALVEVKRPGPASARKLTEAEEKIRADWQGGYVVAQSGEEAAAELLILMRGWA